MVSKRELKEMVDFMAGGTKTAVKVESWNDIAAEFLRGTYGKRNEGMRSPFTAE